MSKVAVDTSHSGKATYLKKEKIKVFPNVQTDGIEGVVLRPVVVVAA